MGVVWEWRRRYLLVRSQKNNGMEERTFNVDSRCFRLPLLPNRQPVPELFPGQGGLYLLQRVDVLLQPTDMVLHLKNGGT